jgi:hypothetical protein
MRRMMTRRDEVDERSKVTKRDGGGSTAGSQSRIDCRLHGTGNAKRVTAECRWDGNAESERRGDVMRVVVG